MKRFFVSMAAVCLLFVSGCSNSTVPCTAETLLVSGVSSGIKTTLNCQNMAAIQSDLTALAHKIVNLCPVTGTMAGVGSSICISLVQIGVQQLGNVIPATWQCSPSMAQAGLASALSLACNAIPF